MKKRTLHLACHIFFSCIVLHAFAQKSPDIQKGSIWLSNGRADGKITEWQLPLKAFNNVTKIRYSIANDDKNLYLAVQTNRGGKLLSGGLTFTVNGAAITFPFVRRRDLRKAENRKPLKPSDPRTFQDFKEIHIIGIKSIPDSLVSIYNIQGIRASAIKYEENEEKFCNYEMSIPLKLLGFSNTKNKIEYNIKLNGIIPLKPGGLGAMGATIRPIPGKSKREIMEIDDKNKDLFRVSQFNGEYILAKKS